MEHSLFDPSDPRDGCAKEVAALDENTAIIAARERKSRFSRSWGVFSENNYGMLKAGCANEGFENSQFIFGATFRL